MKKNDIRNSICVINDSIYEIFLPKLNYFLYQYIKNKNFKNKVSCL